MRTIDDLVSQIAKNTGAKPPVPPNEPKKQTEIPVVVPIGKSVPNIFRKPCLSLALAKEIMYCIEKGAEMSGVNAVISIVNDNGNLIAFEAMDSSLAASVGASQDKAYTAAALRMPTEEALAQSRGGAFDGLTNGNGILLLGGGIPLMIEGEFVGAVGVSGGTKEQDIKLAKIGACYLSERIKYMGEAVK